MTPVTADLQVQFVDDDAWGSRCCFWDHELSHSDKRQSKKQKNREPLVLGGHGASLRIEGGTLAVCGGFTHYPQKRETYRYFKGSLDLPDRIILLDCSGTISLDALTWLAEQKVALVQINWRGEVICVNSAYGYSANPYRAEWQWQTRNNEKQRLEFSIQKITQKIENSISTLEKSIKQGPTWNKAIEIAYSILTKLDERRPRSISELRAMEANAAAAYFRSWRGIPIRWQGTGKRPIPDSWRLVEQRTSPFQLAGNRNAAHPVNAILNYAYAVLQSQLQIKAVAEGFDPTIGIMHEARDGSAAFIFDLMEPERPKADRKVLDFMKKNVFDPADFTIRADGVCRVNPELARAVTVVVSMAG